MSASRSPTNPERRAPPTCGEWIDRHSGRIMVLPAVDRAALLRDLSADHLGLPVAVPLRAGAGRLHAHASSGCSTSRSSSSARSSTTSSARSAPSARSSGWSSPSFARRCSTGSIRYVASSGFTVLGFLGRLISASFAAGARRCSCSPRSSPAAFPARWSPRSSTSSSASPCSSSSASAWRSSAPSRSAAATSSASSSSSR